MTDAENEVFSAKPESEWGVTNLDGAIIPTALADELKAGKRAHFAAWEFSAWLTYDDNNFRCDVWRHHAHVDTLLADSLTELVDDVREKWGSE